MFIRATTTRAEPAGGDLLSGDGGLPPPLPGSGEGLPIHRVRAAGVPRARAVAAGAGFFS